MRAVTTILVLASTILAPPIRGIELGQIDDFQDGTTQGWGAGGRHPDPPSVGAGEGPEGPFDIALQLRATGGGGAGSRLVAFNSTQWTGDYLAAGVGAIALDLRNDTPPRLRVRLALNGPGGWFVTERSAVIPMSGGFARYILPITPDNLAPVTGAPPNVTATLSAVSELRLLHLTQPNDFRGTPISSGLTIDNIAAIAADACTAGGAALPTAAGDDGQLLLPTISVGAGGETTFMAVRNPTDATRGVEVRFFDAMGTLAASELIELGARQVRNFDFSQIAELADGEGPSLGFALACADDRAVVLGGGNVPADAARVIPTGASGGGIAGDYFFLDEPGNFATGDRLLRPEEICRVAEARLLDFGSGASLRLYVEDPRGPAAPSAAVRVFNQAGTLVDSMDLFTSETSTVLDASELTGSRFGTLSLDFSNGGTTDGSGALIVEYSAFGLFSAAMNAECVDPLP